MAKARLAQLLIVALAGGSSLAPQTASDGVNQWAGIGLQGQIVLGLAVDPSDSSTLYAGTFGSGLFKTTDGGSNWSQLTNGLPSGDRPEARALAIDPSSPSTVYVSAGLRAVTGIANSYGLYKSADAGASWTRLSLPTRDGQGFVQQLAVDPASPSVLFATTIEGIFRTTDAGMSWVKVLTDGSYAIAIDSHSPSTVYAGTVHGVLQSTDGGSTWVASGEGQSPAAFAIAVDPVSTGVVYAADLNVIYKLTGAGAGWTPVKTGHYVDALAIPPLSPPTVYAGSPQPFEGVLRGVDGMAWTPFSDGLTGYGYDVYLLKVDPSFAAVLYAATGNGVFRVTTKGPPRARQPRLVPLRQ